MPTAANRTKHLMALTGLPEFLCSWVDHFYEPREIELIDLVGEDTLEASVLQTRWGAASGGTCPQNLEAFLERSFKRGVLHRNDRLQYGVADFHSRYDIWALFESWQDIPDDIRQEINHWELSYYQSQHRHLIEDLRQKNARDTSERWPEYLQLHEAEALINAVEHVYLWPCNCRAMIGTCEKSLYTCLRFSNNRGIGWEISKTRALEILHEANRQGLMQSGEVSILPDNTIGGALCNCCADCCFPHLLAQELHAEKLWPLTRHLARVDFGLCTACGRCVRRCPFGAIALEGQEAPSISIDLDLCRGCGVCSTGCRDEAISMAKIKDVDSLFDTLTL